MFIVNVHGLFVRVKKAKWLPFLEMISLSKNVKELYFEPKKIWVDKCSQFYKRLMKSWLKNNDLDICSRNSW